MIIRTALISGIFLQAVFLVGMSSDYWISWNQVHKRYEYKQKSSRGCKQREELTRQLEAVERSRRQKKQGLTDPEALKVIMQAAKEGSPVAQQKITEAIRITHNQCVVLEYLVCRSVEAQYKKNYACAFDGLRKVRCLLLDTDEKTKEMIKTRGNWLRCYDNLLVDLNLTYYLARCSDDKSYVQNIDLKTHYLKLFASMLKLIQA